MYTPNESFNTYKAKPDSDERKNRPLTTVKTLGTAAGANGGGTGGGSPRAEGYATQPATERAESQPSNHHRTVASGALPTHPRSSYHGAGGHISGYAGPQKKPQKNES